MSVKSVLKKIGSGLKNTWFLALFITLVLVALIWFAGPYIGIADTKILSTVVARLIATLAVVFAWGLFVAVYYSRKRKSELADPDKAAERDRLALDKQRWRDEKKKIKNSIRAAVKTVSSSNFYGTSSRSRYALPWYLLIGTENSGKTSLLFNSGLQFPINEQADRHLYELKATESCEFLYANQAVFIDTPGKYTEAHEEHEVHKLWTSLLRGIFRARTSKPLNGIIVCLSMRDIIAADAVKREHIAKLVRKRLSEVLKCLRAYVPVYLVFTKCDAVPGFAEFFAHLSRAEREQIFGCPAADTVLSSDDVKGELKNLMQTLNAQIISKVHQERDISARGEMFRFPQELANLGPRIEDFIYEAFGPSRYHKPVMLRGFFFTSALSVKDVMASAAADGELAFQKGFQSSLGDYAKGFFLLRLLQDLIIPEARLAIMDKGKRLGLLAQRYVPQIVALGIFFFAVFFMGRSFVNNYQAVDKVSENYRNFVSTHQVVKNVGDARQALPELDYLSRALYVFRPGDDSVFSYGLGLYQGKTISAAASEAYLANLNARLLPVVQRDAAKHMLKSARNMRELKTSLRAYLMLFYPEHLNQKFLLGWLKSMWSEQYRADAETQQKLYRHMNYLVYNGLKRTEPDAVKVAQARKELLKTPLAQLAYQHLQEEAAESGGLPYSFRAAFAGSTSPFSGDGMQIPYLYTKKGFLEFFVMRSQVVIQSLADDSWIYGDNAIKLSSTDVQKLHLDVRNMYFRDYARYWAEALHALKIMPSSSLADSSKRAEQFTGGVSPVVTVLQDLRDNIYLNVDLKELGLEYLGAVAGEDKINQLPEGSADFIQAALLSELNEEALKLRQHFAAVDGLLDENGQAQPLLQAAHDQSVKLGDYFLRLSMSENRSEKVFETLVDILAEHDNTLREAEIAAGRLPQPVGSWYFDLASDGLYEMMRIAARYINDTYAENVYPVYSSEFKSLYPLNAKADRDANIDEFAEFFSPQGILGGFQNSYIKPFINNRGQLRSLMGRRLPLNQEAINQVSKASRVQNAFFGPKGELGVSFLIEPVVMDAELKRVDLINGGTTMSYWHGPVLGVNFSWPVTDNASALAAVQATTLHGYTSHVSAKGDWALFRILQQGKILSRQGNSCVLEIKQSEKAVQLNVQFRNRDNPLDRRVFAFNLPEHLN